MHRIDHPTANLANPAKPRFTQGDPANNIPATRVTDDWLNDVQESLCELVEAAGLALAKGQTDQLVKAVLKLTARQSDDLGALPRLPTAAKAASFAVGPLDRGRLFLVDAAAGPIDIDLPAIGPLDPVTGRPAAGMVEDGFVVSLARLDESSHGVVLAAAPNAGIDGFTNPIAIEAGDRLLLVATLPGWRCLVRQGLASPDQPGAVALASLTQVEEGQPGALAVPPDVLRDFVANSQPGAAGEATPGLVRFATMDEAVGGTAVAVGLTPRSGRQLVEALQGPLAGQLEALSGQVQALGTAAAAASAGMTPHPNLLINGGFGVWQRTAQFSDPNLSPVADRWLGGGGAGNSTTYGRIALAPGEAGLPADLVSALRLSKTAGNGSAPELRQRIEGVRWAAGQAITISGYLRSPAGARDLRVNIVQHFGSDGSAPSFTSAPPWVLGSVWGRHSLVIAVPPIDGKTIGPNRDDYLELQLAWASNANGEIDFAGFKAELGGLSPFVARPAAEEEALCQRYYQVAGYGLAGYWNSPTNIEWAGVFPTRMRASPSISLRYAVATISNKSNSTTGDQSGLSIVGASASALGIALIHTTGSGGFTGAAGHAAQLRHPDLFGCDAEL